MTHHAGPVAAAALIAATPVAFVTFLKGKSAPWVEVPKQVQTACSHTEGKRKGPGKLKRLMHSAWEKGGQKILGRIRSPNPRLPWEI